MINHLFVSAAETTVFCCSVRLSAAKISRQQLATPFADLHRQAALRIRPRHSGARIHGEPGARAVSSPGIHGNLPPGLPDSRNHKKTGAPVRSSSPDRCSRSECFPPAVSVSFLRRSMNQEKRKARAPHELPQVKPNHRFTRGGAIIHARQIFCKWQSRNCAASDSVGGIIHYACSL